MPLKIIFINIKEKHIMKIFKNKKVIVALVALVAAVAIAVSSALLTIAYLTSSAAVSNVFTIGNVGITMTETKVDAEGKKLTSGEQVDTNTYQLIPGKTYDKDPRITVNPGSVGSYLFVLVRNDIEKIEDGNVPASGETGTPPATIAQQLEANGWQKYTNASTGWVYIYVGVNNVPDGDAEATTASTATALPVAAGTYQLFEKFSIDPNADIAPYGAAKITLTAVAIQDDGFGNNIDKAWEAVVATYPYIHTGSNTGSNP